MGIDIYVLDFLFDRGAPSPWAAKPSRTIRVGGRGNGLQCRIIGDVVIGHLSVRERGRAYQEGANNSFEQTTVC